MLQAKLWQQYQYLTRYLCYVIKATSTGTITYFFSQDGDTFTFYEMYASEEALLKHLQDTTEKGLIGKS